MLLPDFLFFGGAGLLPTRGDLVRQTNDRLVVEIRGADPADLAGAFHTDESDARRVLRDLVSSSAAVTSPFAEDHVDLDRVVEPHSDACGEEVAPVDDVLAGILDGSDDRDADGPALRQQEPERSLSGEPPSAQRTR